MKGTRLLKPDVLTQHLDIDRSALDEKDRRDHEKLDAMIRLADVRQCRQQAILEYFGEADASVCGTCDVCRDSFSADVRSPASDAETLIVRKALSGVARMSRKTTQGWEGRFGRGRVVQMLMGSKSQEIQRVQLHTLSTYGLLQDCGTAYLNELFRSMHQSGLVVTQRGEFPLITLSLKGEQVMLGKASFQLAWPGKKNESMVKGDDLSVQEYGFDAKLYAQLRDLRDRLAKAKNVPAYQIFPNKTLENFTRIRPTTMAEGLRIKGVGIVKAKTYLQDFLDEIYAYEA